MERVEVAELDCFEDQRGWLLKVIRRENVGERGMGEVYVTASYPGITRAKHYHEHTTEWFCVVKGTAKLVLEDTASAEREEITLGGGRFTTVRVPPGIAHAIKNIGEETAYLVAVADQSYDAERPDTFPYEVEI
jgi:dTDP-4-dehydrorhamnose 3,5-epimerase-like enzyme